MSSPSKTSKMASVAVVGGGLVGALLSVTLARRGFEVHLYESRPDIRKQPKFRGRSINLALSNRGIKALQIADIDKEILEKAIPMSGRMIHDLAGNLADQPYGKEGQAINAIDRRLLNEMLLTRAEKSGVRTHFESKIINGHTKNGTLTFKSNGIEHTKTFDFVFGADGIHSPTRQFLMRRGRVSFEQQFIAHGYKELRIDADQDGKPQLPLNYLHIWPRGTFMMIALPNPDNSFTLTLFMPFDTFDAIKTEQDVMTFFEKYFPDSIKLIGRERLLEDYFANPTSPLSYIKCSKFHSGKFAILGDAAHAIVPFYGQGMNSGFEDVSIVEELLEKHKDSIGAAMAEFSETRPADAHAIADLALYNYIEMRDKVNSKWFLFRKKLDSLTNKIFPSYIPLYSMVTFSHIPYATVVDRHRKQTAIMDATLAITGTCAAAGIVGALWAWRSELPKIDFPSWPSK